MGIFYVECVYFSCVLPYLITTFLPFWIKMPFRLGVATRPCRSYVSALVLPAVMSDMPVGDSPTFYMSQSEPADVGEP